MYFAYNSANTQCITTLTTGVIPHSCVSLNVIRKMQTNLDGIFKKQVTNRRCSFQTLAIDVSCGLAVLTSVVNDSSDRRASRLAESCFESAFRTSRTSRSAGCKHHKSQVACTCLLPDAATAGSPPTPRPPATWQMPGSHSAQRDAHGERDEQQYQTARHKRPAQRHHGFVQQRLVVSVRVLGNKSHGSNALEPYIYRNSKARLCKRNLSAASKRVLTVVFITVLRKIPARI